MTYKTKVYRWILAVAFACSTAAGAFMPAWAATFSATIDFEGLDAGDIVSAVSHGSGISGDDGGGFVGIFGFRPTRNVTNFAMIFDAACGGSALTCTGDDGDLFNPALGKVLIISEDLDSTDPDDADDVGAHFEFDFSPWADGVVTVDSIDVQDIEAEENEGGGQIHLFAGGGLITSVAIPFTGDGNSANVPVGVSGVDAMIVDLNGSGAIDNIAISWEEQDDDGGEGCTPGFWRQPHHFDSWVGYSPGDSYDATFAVSSSFGGTLLDALVRGGGGEAALGRHAVAALLNAASPDVDYLYSEAEVIAIVQSAYSSGEFEDAKDTLELQNELGCGLD